MPEISVCLFDLNLLFKLLVRKNSEFNKQIQKFESEIDETMEENRTKLFEYNN